jgi:hypothetical protein
MKHFLIFLCVFFVCPKIIHGQCKPGKPQTIPRDATDSRIKLGIATGINQSYSCPSTVTSNGVTPDCGITPKKIKWKVEFYFKDNNRSWVRYKVKILRRETNQVEQCISNGTCGTLNFSHIYETLLITRQSSSSNDNFTEYVEVPVEVGFTYYAKITYQTRGWTWPVFWKNIETNSWNVYDCCLSPQFKLNNLTNDQMTLSQGTPIRLDLTVGKNCIDNYFMSVQESDANWNRYGSENMKWLSPSEVGGLGGVSNLNVHNFNSWYGTFNFQKNKYYRIKIAVGDPWTERTVLLYLN